MNKTILAAKLAVLAGLVILSGCAPGGASRIITETRDFTDFTSVDVEGAFEVKITQSDSYGIEISADDNFFDYITVAKDGDTLRIYLNPRHTFADFTQPARTLKAEITMPALDALTVSGATEANVSGFKSVKGLELVISGASSVALADMEAGDLDFEISGASKLSGDLKGKDAKIEISGASSLELDGSAGNIELETSGASKAEMAAFPVDNARVELSGASQSTLNIKGRLDALLSGASVLYFQGNPTLGNISVTGASTIKNR